MIDSTVRELLETTINSPAKLQLLLLFCENPRLDLNATQAANRMYRDIWSTSEALNELYRDQVLETDASEDPHYFYQPHPEYVEAINNLVACYNEPLEREHIQQILHAIAADLSYHRAKRQISGAFELQML